ncbi:hypothetical protein RI129_009304 [Pyrocoelia pectoralis]|uniref:Protein C10 n=1 Tax=Pyrocoelia pectoralis TaxID=417401 RepID=A0AAN7ZER8_9COLE
MSKEELIPNLTPEIAITILNKVLDQLQDSSNIQKLDEAKDNHIFPIIMQVEMEIIKDFGFPEGREGIVKFAQMLRNLEREDVEIARLHNLIKAYYLPPVSVNTTNESPNDDRISSN